MQPTLDEALEVFGRTRSSEVTPLIIELGRNAEAEHQPPQARKNYGFHVVWLSSIADPKARTWALKTLTAKLPRLADGKEELYGDQSEALVSRIHALAKLPPDPRIAAALVALARLNPPIVGFYEVMEAMAQGLVKRADDSTRAAPRLSSRSQRSGDGGSWLKTPATTRLHLSA